jgi:hypothetical protein
MRITPITINTMKQLLIFATNTFITLQIGKAPQSFVCQED